MKIGKVVKKYGIPVSSLYFYIKNGLLVPPRRNNQYIFDERTQSDLELIQELKEMDFPLKTIHRLLSLRRISNFYSEEDRIERRDIFLAHERELEKKEAALSDMREKVRRYIAEFDDHKQSGNRSGVPVEMLRLLCCPHCNSELMMDGVSMSQQYIFHANLSCSCGYKAAITDGILCTKNINTSLYDKPDTTRELYRDLPSRTLSLFENSYNWLTYYLKKHVSPGKVWLEAYPTAWFFFHNHLELLSKEDCLIVIDKFPETLLAYKEVIDEQNPKCKILYIADASTSLPLKKESIDCCMDFFAVNEYNFYHEGLFLSEMIPYFKQNVELFGVYFFFRNGRKSVAKYLDSYPEGTSSNFNINWFMSEMKKEFRILETVDCGSSLDSGQNLGLGFHVPGEELHLQPYHAKLK
ncbi:MAG TPA: MerR family transcriptional regulator [Mogibacterium sp.]|nr:MerR family transcriptional regulator [Mogibacterium sp.]